MTLFFVWFYVIGVVGSLKERFIEPAIGSLNNITGVTLFFIAFGILYTILGLIMKIYGLFARRRI